MHSILQRIAEHKQLEVQTSIQQRPITDLDIDNALPLRNFVEALKTKNPAIIAEIKKASPTQGIIRDNFNVASIAKIYEQHGACCLSVLTDVNFFQGDPSYLAIAKKHCQLPILRKDFIINDYQIHESRALGADCILLIVALLDDKQLQDYCQLAQELGMAVLVESHTLEELERALTLPTPLMGVNNRSLHTFNTDIQCSIDLKRHIPTDKILISESGIHDHQDIQRLQSHEIHTFLVGEHLMRAPDIGMQLKQLIYGNS